MYHSIYFTVLVLRFQPGKAKKKSLELIKGLFSHEFLV